MQNAGHAAAGRRDDTAAVLGNLKPDTQRQPARSPVGSTRGRVRSPMSLPDPPDVVSASSCRRLAFRKVPSALRSASRFSVSSFWWDRHLTPNPSPPGGTPRLYGRRGHPPLP